MSNFQVLKMALAALTVFMSSFVSHAAQTPVQDQTIRAGGQTFRYLSAGTSGPAIVLLHGWPQSADEFREIMPILARTHIVYAPDLSGIGGTTAPLQDWRKETLARDVKRFVDALQLEKPLLVGHDIGGMVAYAYARQFQNQLSGVVILDVPIPRLAPWVRYQEERLRLALRFSQTERFGREPCAGEAVRLLPLLQQSQWG